MALVRGPFKFKWGTNVLSNISEMDFSYDVEESDTSTLDGNKYTIQTGLSASATLTLLDNDVASLATILPQYYVAKGAKLSTGETVGADKGAVDIAAASCSSSVTYNNLDIWACGANDNTEVMRLVNARTQVDSIDLGDGLRTVQIKFIGEPKPGHGAVQFLNSKESFVS
jgi:hypothetical protein